MDYTLNYIIEFITEIGFQREVMYDLKKPFTTKDYNQGYIGAYEYDNNLIHLYDTKLSLYFFNKISQSSKLSFQRLDFNKAVSKLFVAFSSELRTKKIKKILEKLGN